MGGQEFLDKLRLALSGQVAASQVEESIAYYREYISTQIRMGQSEETVLRNLGDPRLIAKSIISANAGEEFKSLEKTASGGELSRFMLALKTQLSVDSSTYIFDEIDSGVSGRAAEKIGSCRETSQAYRGIASWDNSSIPECIRKADGCAAQAL